MSLKFRRMLLCFVVPICFYCSLAAQTPRVTGYFPQWGLYDETPYTVRALVEAHGAERLNQLNYAQAFVKDGQCSVADPNADLGFVFSAAQSVDGVGDGPAQPLRGYLNQLVKLKRRDPKLKILISLEGQGASFAEDAQPENRERFVRSCVDLFLKGDLAPGVHAPGLFDGVDLDWEYPQEQDAANFLGLLTEFRRQMNALRPGMLLNIAVGPSPRMLGGEAGLANLAAVSGLVDQIGLMTYDFTGPWAHNTGFLARFSSPDGSPGGSVKRSVEAFLDAGVPAAKLSVGVPFYGYGWHQVPEDANGLFQEGLPIRGDRPYRYIATLIPDSTVYREEASGTPWLFDGDAFWTYDDAVSIGRKGAYVLDRHLGGLMIWELGEDTSAGTLLKACWDALHPYLLRLQTSQ